MIEWLLKLFPKFSIVGTLRERQALLQARLEQLQAENTSLKNENSVLKAKIDLLQIDNKKLENEFDDFKKLHTEAICIYRSVEFRRGIRTGKKWMAFCPSCHLPLRFEIGNRALCSRNCGWQSEMDAKTIRQTIEFFDNPKKPPN